MAIVDGRRQYSSQEEWSRECDAITLQDAWPVIVRAWAERRQRRHWRLIANAVNFTRGEQADAPLRAPRRKSKADPAVIPMRPRAVRRS